ncbi:hypothetical protein Cni_G04958 [Canna indica]|uniref:Methyl-CpG-binding domain-containing protein 8 n=1 Tax=Canna indica TaxID=4628 RepID=A0AAQ3JWU7_9LILI|nr:hypothetical protein Cni_G04958 [Canna indica]
MAASASEVIPVVDLRFLSQEEISSLSLSCPNAFDLCRSDDVVAPKIDRSVFNESAGSRKQTYSRLRLDPHNPDPTAPSIVASRRPRGLFSPPPPSSCSSSSSAVAPVNHSLTEAGNTDDDDPGRHENLQIVYYLRQLFARGVPAPRTQTQSTPITAHGIPNVTNISGPQLQVPDRAEFPLVEVDGGDREVLNRKDETVDLIALGQKMDPFADELRRRTVGLTTEEQLLDFMSGFDGQWGSRRRRRRIVDASVFGDHLPRGWKLLLSLKRKEGEVWVYCRRYISPSGKQFLSCKEVSSYILTLVGDPNALLPVSVQDNVSAPRSEKLNTDYAAIISDQEHLVKERPKLSLGAPFSSSSADHEKQIGEYNVEDQHQMPCHQINAKRRKLDKLIGEGIIIKDGKFECQICHEMFTDRNHYNGHIGTHVRYQGPNAETLPDESSSGKIFDPAPLAEISYDHSLHEIKKSSTLKSSAEIQLASTNLQCQKGNHEIDHNCTKHENSKIGSAEIAHAVNNTDQLFSSITKGIDAIVVPTIDMAYEKVAEENSTTCADNQIDDCHHKPEETTKTGDVRNIEAGYLNNHEGCNINNVEVCSFRNTDSCDFNNIGASNFMNAEPASVQINDHYAHGYNSEIVTHTAEDDTNGYNTVSITNSSCEIVTEAAQFFPVSMSMDFKINYRDVTRKPEKNAETDNKGIKANSPIDSISTSFMSLDNVVPESSNEIGAASCTSISDIGKYVMGQKLDIENHLVTLQDNSSSYVTEGGVIDTFASNVKENAIVGADESSRKVDLASSHAFSNVNIVSQGILQMELNSSCINIPFVDESSTSNARNRECTFNIDIEGSMLGEMDGPAMELNQCFDDSNSANKEVDPPNTVHEGNSLEIDFNLCSPWLHSSDHIPDVGMSPDQFEDGVSVASQKEKLSGFAHLTLDAVESSELVHLGGEASIPVPEPSIGLGYMPELDNEGCSSVQLGWDISLQNSAYELRSVCVWCNGEFSHVASSAEEESDTLGFICPACKAKISGHLTIFNNH